MIDDLDSALANIADHAKLNKGLVRSRLRNYFPAHYFRRRSQLIAASTPGVSAGACTGNALAMASAGLGVTVCLPYAASMVEQHGLVMCPLDEPQLTRRIFIYTKAQRSLSPAAESFIAALVDFVGAELVHSPDA